MAARAIIFDLDGTIWDSYPWYARILAEEGGASEESTLVQLQRGFPIVHLLRRYEVSDSRLISRVSELRLYSDVRETLEELESQGTATGIMTSLPGRLAIPILKGVGLKRHFGAIIHAGNCRFRKPNPRPLLMAAGALAIEVGKDAFYVGDRSIDADAASRAGLEFAWASYGYGDSCPPTTRVVLECFSDVLTL